jgi:hypothetical protein
VTACVCEAGIALGDVVVAHPVLGDAVEVRVVAQARFLPGAHERLAQLVVLDLLGDVRGAVELLLRNGLEAPVDRRAGELREAHRHVDQWVPVAAAGLQQEHGGGRVLAQAARDDASCGARADDDVVVPEGRHRCPI